MLLTSPAFLNVGDSQYSTGMRKESISRQFCWWPPDCPEAARTS
jgi:hypothetical protein